ncbi:MAG: M15 family metallopeptidase [Bacillota bacterium]|jgi:D-alanyl-D-alanine carboxypeptidase|nr:M15 family metallopeptidase [Bacillota bacterium]MDD3298330.1 M15 family metallopeptidase [Bacillota bacterium]MDD3851691.1 M15 family metallopeptidase [Bacillota bacterium]MDD4706770.1 M15 family metallopeptidase [Bacillota bacterium]
MRSIIKKAHTSLYIIRASIVCVAVLGLITGTIHNFYANAKTNPQQASIAAATPAFPETDEESPMERLDDEPDMELANYSSFPYFRENKIQEYIDYKARSEDLTYQTVVTNVNIGLDKPYYFEIKTIIDPGSVSTLVNKYNMLPDDYIPDDLEKISGTDYLLRHQAREAFENMRNDAKELGLNVFPVSTYRSYKYQKSIYDKRVAERGQANVDRTSARPGHSEHQLGLAVDVIGTGKRVADSEEYAWYSKNAHRYGFIIRYPEDKEHITGYSYEPWHLRYLGDGLAAAVYESGLTYDEYYVRFLQPE